MLMLSSYIKVYDLAKCIQTVGVNLNTNFYFKNLLEYDGKFHLKTSDTFLRQWGGSLCNLLTFSTMIDANRDSPVKSILNR